MVRSIDTETRTKLFARLGVTEMHTLRSFLDKPRAKGQTQKGEGKVGFYLNRDNTTRVPVQAGTDLYQQVNAHNTSLF